MAEELKKFKKRHPVVVTAIQVTQGMMDGTEPLPNKVEVASTEGKEPFLYMDTMHGRKLVSVGDWIIKDARGETYPCLKHVFEKAYEPYKESVSSRT